MSIKVAIFGPNLPRPLSDTGMFVVHVHGCPDTAKGLYRRLGPDSGGWAMEADSEREVVEEIFSDFLDENDWQDLAHSIRFFPCLDLPVEVT